MAGTIQGIERPALFTQSIAVLDRAEYDALLQERDFLAASFIRRRVVTLVCAFTLMIAASLVGFFGGIWLSRDTNDQSFKVACSRVVDEVMQSAASRAGRTAPLQAAAVQHTQPAGY